MLFSAEGTSLSYFAFYLPEPTLFEIATSQLLHSPGHVRCYARFWPFARYGRMRGVC